MATLRRKSGERTSTRTNLLSSQGIAAAKESICRPSRTLVHFASLPSAAALGYDLSSLRDCTERAAATWLDSFLHVTPGLRGCYETQCALTTVEQDCRNPVPQARNNRSPARSRRRSAGLSGKFDSSPEGTAPFRNTLLRAGLTPVPPLRGSNYVSQQLNSVMDQDAARLPPMRQPNFTVEWATESSIQLRCEAQQ